MSLWDWFKADSVQVDSDGSWAAEQVRTGDKGMTVHRYVGKDVSNPSDHAHFRHTYDNEGNHVKSEKLHD